MPRLVPYRTALVVIDMQRGFENEHTRHLPEQINRLVDSGRFGHVIYTQFFNGRGSPFRRILNWRRFIGTRDTDLMEGIAERARRVVTKHRYTCFCPEMLRYLGINFEIDTLCFCGVDTDCCVLKSAVDAFEQGYIPYVLVDCCASHAGPQAHAAGLAILRRMIGEAQLVDSKTLLARLRGPLVSPTLPPPAEE